MDAGEDVGRVIYCVQLVLTSHFGQPAVAALTFSLNSQLSIALCCVSTCRRNHAGKEVCLWCNSVVHSTDWIVLKERRMVHAERYPLNKAFGF